MKSLTPFEFATDDRSFDQMLDKTLKKCGVEHQAYIEGTFVETISTSAARYNI